MGAAVLAYTQQLQQMHTVLCAETMHGLVKVGSQLREGGFPLGRRWFP